MNLVQLANRGAFIGGVAVLVTLIDLAVQMRQSNVLAQAEAQQSSNETFSRWRQMVADNGINGIWLKALDDEDRPPRGEHRLYVVICEMTYAAIATMENQVAVENRNYTGRAPQAIARELQSEFMRKTWKRVASNL